MTARTIPAAAVSLAALAACLAGCSGPHTISGRVVEGPSSYIYVVDPDDPRLTHPGVPGAVLHLEHRPGKLKHKTIDRELSGDDGRFVLTVDRFLAGAIEYDVALHAERAGLRQTTRFFPLPTDDDKQLLVVLAREASRDTAQAP
jgi:hypothetical protein